MATYTVTIPDDLVAEADTAARRTNERQPANQRQPGPLTFGDAEATDVIYQWLHNLIIVNLQQEQDIFQAALASGASVIPQSLMDFIG